MLYSETVIVFSHLPCNYMDWITVMKQDIHQSNCNRPTLNRAPIATPPSARYYTRVLKQKNIHICYRSASCCINVWLGHIYSLPLQCGPAWMSLVWRYSKEYKVGASVLGAKAHAAADTVDTIANVVPFRFQTSFTTDLYIGICTNHAKTKQQ